MGTPIFDTLQAEQGIAIMPLLPMETHDEFLCRNEYPEFLMRAEGILRGDIRPEKPTPIRKPRARKPKPSS